MDKLPKTTKPAFPMRINKYLALKGYSTRRGADELIEKKRVTINGRIAVLGDKVLEKDVVELKKDSKPKAYIYLAYNKPRHQTAEEINIPGGVFPVDPLDKMAEGLMLMTNDRRLTDRLLNPEHAHEKEYIVSFKEKLRNNFKEKITGGLKVDGQLIKPIKVDLINDYTFRLVIAGGKVRLVRRLALALFNEVQDLKCVRILNIHLDKLAANQTRPIEGEELATFLKDLGL